MKKLPVILNLGGLLVMLVGGAIATESKSPSPLTFVAVGTAICIVGFALGGAGILLTLRSSGQTENVGTRASIHDEAWFDRRIGESNDNYTGT
ncbi:hypothetical protein AYO40_06005 [Planctomycetaceae bacterium SCGC AG-212-D15]|nr:hypothetical protein AYO40_06005 [Planctomycetaceae bacterium SCGC AG-212-D15]